LLGLLQGIAEFLPISSSGHLAIAQELFNLEDVPLLFDVFLHLATLGAVVLFFRKRIWSLFQVMGRWICRRSLPEDKADLQTIVALLLGTLVTGIFGILLSDVVEDIDEKFICVGFFVTAGLLIFSDAVEEGRRKKRLATDPDFTVGKSGGVKPLQGLGIGLAQGFGVLPGISRSGSTIAGALLCGVDREQAGEFSFLLSIPAILGAFVLQLEDLDEIGSAVGIAPVVAGCIAAFVAGIFALSVLMKIVRKGKLEWFAVYLIPLGILGLIFL
ncbi:MAG: undecaprenyl-diphosphate phosphatase, partial [Spirochaetaceae bacterium]|nr:undecaprenyl-diphosphate phosphatase [Spirochaetaceae bacterium]